MAGIYDERILGAKQQAETARKLREGITSPQGQMVSGWYVGPSWTQYAANALRQYGATKQEREAETAYEEAQRQKQQETEDLLRQINPAEIATPTPEQTMALANQQPMDLAASGGAPQSDVSYVQPNERTRMAALLRGASVNPDVFQPQLQMAQWEMSQAEKQAAREQAEALRREQMQQQREMQQERLQSQREMAAQAAADRRALAGLAQSNRQSGGIGWKYDAGSDTWVAPPSAQFPQGISTASAPRVKSAENFSYLANQMLGTKDKPGEIYKTTTGGWMGLGGQVGRVTDSQQQRRFNNLREQMSTELRTIFRIPGEGALSDKEQAQYGVQLPDIGNDPALNEAIVKDLQFRIQNKTTAGANPLAPSGADDPLGIRGR